MSKGSRKDGHETMKRTKIILYVAVGIVAAVIIGCIALVPSNKGDRPNAGGESVDSNISINVPGTTASPEDTESDDTTLKGVPKVENSTHEDATDKIPAPSTPETGDKVVSGVKDKGTVETGPASGEDRNDEILKEKEENAPESEKEEDKPVIVEDEKTSVTDGKGDAQITDEKTNVDGGDKNGLVYSPSIGGDNPFDNDTQTEIDDRPVEDYIGDGENRPGEGIQF